MINLSFRSMLVALTFSLTSYAHAKIQDFDHWSLVCNKEKNYCAISQIITTDPEAKRVLAGLSISHSPIENKTVMSIRVSSLAMKDNGIGFKIDQNQPVRLGIVGCNNAICESRVWLDNAFIDEMKQGKKAALAFQLADQKKIVLPVSITGFEPAFEALREMNM